jgi:16S rRNA G966 N2-methylase RsmD
MAVLAVFSGWTYSGLFLLELVTGLGELSLEALSKLARGILVCSIEGSMYNDYKACRIL